jgi:hypothetical protein
LGTSCGDCHNARDWKSTEGLFKHERTKFPLKNAHAKQELKCSGCHKNLASFRNTSLDCLSCHKKDDKHEGQLGVKCETCHNDKVWKDTRFDHGLSRFPLTGGHLIPKCKACHETPRYKDAPRDCFSCHKKDDKHKKVFGVRCETCHNARTWGGWSYDHDTRTKFRLEGGHAKVACASCHKQPAPADKDAAPLGVACVSCHRGNDPHNGTYGPRCEICHRVDSWKKLKGKVSSNPAGPKNEYGVKPEGYIWAS